MKLSPSPFLNALACSLVAVSALATDYFVSPSGANVPPYDSWANAATNIQLAIDAASAGDLVWVTNGLYLSGSRQAPADPTANRIVLSKSLTVQSVNGPSVTIIQGAGDPSTLGTTNALRCAWLTNGASLNGFTLRGGTTQTSSSGGGAYGYNSLNLGTLANCVLSSNTTTLAGGGVYQVALTNCLLVGNSAGTSGGGAANSTLMRCVITSNSASNSGGGAMSGTLKNCAVTHNSAKQSGGGVYTGTLLDCTLALNTAGTTSPTGNGTGGGASSAKLTNCIVFANRILNTHPGLTTTNYDSCTLGFSCADPLAPGTGNIGVAPQLLADGIHLAVNSPCRGAGTATVVSGTDIDGEPWASPPPMGCDEWSPVPLIAAAPQPQVGGNPAWLRLVGLSFSGQEPLTFAWMKDGVAVSDDRHYGSATTSTLVVSNFGPADAGAYQVILSNAYGIMTSAVAQVTVHCVNQAGTAPLLPFSDWLTAATNVQDAIDAAASGDLVLVTNGVYAFGGRAADADLTNRVLIDKPLTVQSVNGPNVTVIQGAFDPATTNGPLAVRCAWLTNGATLSGFTLLGGATRAFNATTTPQQNGGGASGPTNALLLGCVLLSNSAGYYGGGAYQLMLSNCILTGNSANSGGGAANCILNGCAVLSNSAPGMGGGAYASTLFNCTLSANQAGAPVGPVGYGGGAYISKLTNCIVFGNRLLGSSGSTATNYASSTLAFCCASPLASGPGNIVADPQFLVDGLHLAATSPCRGAGANSVVSGTDIDGQPWSNPPPIGCDEWSPAPLIVASPKPRSLGSPASLQFTGLSYAGQEPLGFYWTRNASPLSDNDHYADTTTAILRIKNLGPDDAGGYQIVVSNSFGLAISAVAAVVVHCVDPACVAPRPPYSDWVSAATNIQDAIDAAGNCEFVVVTNGIYNSGGKVMFGTLLNRIAVDKPLTVLSANGPAVTVLRGPLVGPDLGDSAVRCAWLTNGASLVGFTLQGGSTRTNGDIYQLCSGGGLWAASTNAMVLNCDLKGNTAAFYGAGAYQATLANCHIWNNVANQQGGGSAASALINCTVADNTASWHAAGLLNGSARNCIFSGNLIQFPLGFEDVYSSPGRLDVLYSCTAGITSGTGNIVGDPQTLDGIHLKSNSPCRGAGSPAYSLGNDFDGEDWANPPSMGCDERWESAFSGPLAITSLLVSPPAFSGLPYHFTAGLSGRVSRLDWSFGDGRGLTNGSAGVTNNYASPGVYTVTVTAFNLDHPSGVSTNFLLRVPPFNPPQLTPTGLGLNGLTFSFTGLFGVAYSVEQAGDLTPPVTWKPLTNFTGAGGLIQVNAPYATNEAGYYRVRLQVP